MVTELPMGSFGLDNFGVYPLIILDNPCIQTSLAVGVFLYCINKNLRLKNKQRFVLK